MKRTNLLLTGVLFLMAAVQANGDIGPLPLYETPPDWAGTARTTYNAWDFLEPTYSGEPIHPDFGDGSGIINPAEFSSWLPEVDGLPGVIEDPFRMEIEIRNFPEPLDEKRIWIQLNWGTIEPAFPPEDIFRIEAIGHPFGTQGFGEHLWTEEIGQGQFFWNHSVFEIVLEPNPEFEIITIDFITPIPPFMLDSIIIDTICQVPEPTTMVLLGLGGLAFRRRRHK